ncbi:MAG: AsmA family protein, partial [Desulfobacterales bacterium]|nr:AsmA family protein [Desulfobacterales bacterium]
MLKKIIIGVVVFFILIAVLGFFILPAVIKPTLTKKLAENLHRKVSIEDIDINPFIISAKIKELVIRDPQDQETFASIGELYINLQAAESVLKSALVVEEIRIDKPYVKIIRQTGEQYNFSDLIKNDGVKEKEDTKKEPLNFFIGNIQVEGGRIDVVDSPKNKQHALTDISFA